MQNNTTGSDNIAVGDQAGGNITTGIGNVVMGTQAGVVLGISTGSNNILLGKSNTGITTGSGNVVIGKVTGLAANTENTINIADGVGNISFRKNTDGTVTLPAMTNTLINADASGKAIVTKEYITSVVKPYKSYIAILNQTGTAAPVATVLENNIGSIVRTRSSTGFYLGTLTSAFVSDKTVVFVTPANAPNHAIKAFAGNPNAINIFTADLSGNSIDEALARTSVEIRVYN